MGNVIIAMPKSDDSRRISEIIQNGGLGLSIDICSSGSDVLRTSNEKDSGVVICTKKFSDMGYMELSEYLPKNFGMIILTNDASLYTSGDNVVKLMLPIKRSELISTVQMMTSGFGGFSRKKKKPPKERSEEDRKTIDRAKGLLMERNGMSEPEAFRYIQKTSMDYSRSLVETAHMILLMNEQ